MFPPFYLLKPQNQEWHGWSHPIQRWSQRALLGDDFPSPRTSVLQPQRPPSLLEAAWGCSPGWGDLAGELQLNSPGGSEDLLV